MLSETPTDLAYAAAVSITDCCAEDIVFGIKRLTFFENMSSGAITTPPHPPGPVPLYEATSSIDPDLVGLHVQLAYLQPVVFGRLVASAAVTRNLIYTMSRPWLVVRAPVSLRRQYCTSDSNSREYYIN